MDTRIIPITEFIRNFGRYADMLPSLRKIILTREGWPYAEVKLTPEERNGKLLKLAGAWKGTELDDDVFWKKVLTRKSRKKPITL